MDLFLLLLHIVFLTSIVCCFRAVSSMAIGLLLLAGLVKNKQDGGNWLNKHCRNPFLIGCCLFYLVQLAGLLYTNNPGESIKEMQIKSALFFVPLALCCCNFLNANVFERIMQYFTWIIAAMLLYCLLLALYKFYVQGASNDVFFYHALVLPFQQHAVQVSIYVFAALVYLLEKVVKRKVFYNRAIHYTMLLYLTCCILLLSSKLVIVFLAGLLLYYFFLGLKTKLHRRIIPGVALITGFVIIVLVLSSGNRISRRFNEIGTGNLWLFEQPVFSPGIYFNGLQFRLLQWRFVREILTEQHAWFKGVTGEAQHFLDNKYTSTHMYTGDGAGHGGYLSYNTHDQFLQSLLQSGIVGLIAFVLVCAAMLLLAIRRKSRVLTAILLLLLAYCFNEAVFETQYGIVLFTYFPLLIYYGTENTIASKIRLT